MDEAPMPMIDGAGLRLVEGPLPGPESRAIGSKNRFRDTNRVRDPCVLEFSFGAELVDRRGADPRSGRDFPHRQEPATCPHFEPPLVTETGGLMLFVQYQGPTTGGRPIYDGRFNMTARRPISEENVER